jgi:hypothetical protein
MKLLIMLVASGVVVGLSFIVLSWTSYIGLIIEAKARGLYPKRGEATIEDVKRLLLSGERFWAINAYREMYRLSFEQAELEVDLLERRLEESILEEDE